LHVNGIDFRAQRFLQGQFHFVNGERGIGGKNERFDVCFHRVNGVVTKLRHQRHTAFNTVSQLHKKTAAHRGAPLNPINPKPNLVS
jgi:hypothetical protein